MMGSTCAAKVESDVQKCCNFKMSSLTDEWHLWAQSLLGSPLLQKTRSGCNKIDKGIVIACVTMFGKGSTTI